MASDRRTPGLPDPGIERTTLDGESYHRWPYGLFSSLRAQSPVAPVDFPAVHAWLLTGYRHSRDALNDPRLGKAHCRASRYFMENASIMPEPQRSALQSHLLHVDGERHAVMRPLVAGPLSARRVESLRGFVRRSAHDIIDTFPEIADSGTPVDIIPALTARLPLVVLAEAIGLSPELRDRFDPAWCTVVAPVAPGQPGRDTYQQRLESLRAYIADIVDHTSTRSESPAALPGDFGDAEPALCRVIAAADRGEISTAERDSIIFQLLVAGQDPVNAQLQLMLMSLMAHPEALTELTTDVLTGADVSRAVEELLRYDAAFNLATWRFLADDQGLHGVAVPAGDSVIVALGAANHDPETFEEPDQLNLSRSPNPHLSFGHGPHVCPGAALARIIFQETLTALLQRLPGLALGCPAEELHWSHAPLTRAVTHLPITYHRRLPGVSAGRHLETARQVMDILIARARWSDHVDECPAADVGGTGPASGKQPTAEDCPTQLNAILHCVDRNEPIVFALPGFPCKSPNPQKVAGRLPDEGERRALHELHELCTEIADVYESGARVIVCSDGHVFSDVIGVSDADISAYGVALRLLVTAEGLSTISMLDLSDLWGNLSFTAKRDRLEQEWSGSIDTLHEEAREGGETTRVLRGMTRFMLDDAVDLPTGTSARQREARHRAYRVLSRSRAWGEVISRHLPNALRLSIHPQPLGADKFGISLVKPGIRWVTPWHSTVLLDSSGTATLLRHDEARRRGIPCRRDGSPTCEGDSPWYFQELTNRY